MGLGSQVLSLLRSSYGGIAVTALTGPVRRLEGWRVPRAVSRWTTEAFERAGSTRATTPTG